MLSSLMSLILIGGVVTTCPMLSVLIVVVGKGRSMVALLPLSAASLGASWLLLSRARASAVVVH